MKAGINTTEFWLNLLITALGIIGPMFGLPITPDCGIIAAGISNAAYATSRGLAKKGNGVP